MAEINNKSSSANGKAHGENSTSFENNFARLQEVVAKLSEGNLTLEDALSSYEEGMALADRCARMLEEAELRVKQVSERAMRAGVASLDDLREVIGNIESETDQSFIAIEIESYSSDPIAEDKPAAKGTGSKQESPAFDKKPQVAQRPAAQPLLSELDPLFDDED